ncbi:MAG: dioxygenase [Solirubrobacteraceae bacterium]
MSAVPTADFTEETSAQAVVASLADTPDARRKEVLSSLVRHLHGFVRDVGLTQGEWDAAIDFLTRTGQKCDEHRQEFILLSDVLGVSMLVDAINNRRPADATSSTVLGPFHVVDSPVRELGDDITLGNGGGEPCVVTGEVRSLTGQPLGGALLDVWQADETGFYDVQLPGEVPIGELRGLFTADADGRFWFRTIVPAPYPIPHDGPVGELLAATNRHPNRPAHIHVIAGAEGHDPVTTHMFVAGSPWLDSDAVFGVKENLVRPFELVDDEARAAAHGVPSPFRHAHFDVVLRPTVR